MKFEGVVKYRPSPVVSVFGVGNAGVEIVNSLFSQDIHKINFVAASSDFWTLDKCKVNIQIQLGAILTRGTGTATTLSLGIGGVFENILDLEQLVVSVDLLFIIVGLGGGTGTTASSVVAELARRKNTFVVGIIIMPFEFEGERRKFNAMFGLELFRRIANLAIIIPNDKLFTSLKHRVEMSQAFATINKTIYNIVKGMITVIIKAGVFNVNFNDALIVLQHGGTAYVGSGHGAGYRRSLVALREALVSSFLNSIVISRARSIFITFLASDSLCLREINNAVFYLLQKINYNADLVVGYGVEKKLGGILTLTIVATGLDHPLIPYAVKRRKLFFKFGSILRHVRPFVGVSIYDPKTKFMPVKLLPQNTELKSKLCEEVNTIAFLKRQRREMAVSSTFLLRKNMFSYYKDDLIYNF